MGAVTAQVLIALFVSVPIFMIAFSNVWPSYALKLLESDDSPLGYKITQNQGSLIGSLPMLGSLASITVVSYITEKIGRKRTKILSSILFVLSWSIITTAKSVTQLIIGRFIAGIGAGLYLVTIIVFIGEISHPSVRGLLMPISGSMYSFGTLISYIEGWFFSYELINYLCLTILVVFVVLLLFLKETPHYLLRHGKEKEALNSLKFYRGTSKTTQKILDELAYMKGQQGISNNHDISDIKSVNTETEKLNQEKCSEIKQNSRDQSSWQVLCSSKSSQRAILTLAVQVFLSVMMGLIGIQTYAGQLFRRAAPDLSPDLCSVILAIVLFSSSALAVFVTDLFPRRILMISSCILSAVCMALLASMLRWSWAPDLGIPLMIVLFCLCFQIGSINVPFVQISECLAPQVQSIGSTFITATMFLANFIVLYLFKPCLALLGLDGIFLVFAVIGLVTAAVAYFWMRETRRVPLEVVQDMFEDGYMVRRKQETYIRTGQTENI